MNQPGFLTTLLSFIAVIAPLIFVHELGHYFVGRWFGVKAETFSIGFGREILGHTDARGTRWKIGWLPLGGYVKFAGDMSPASTPSDDWLKLPPEERAGTFQSKTLWQKSLIVVAGPAVNFLVALLIFAGLIAIYGQSRTLPRVDELVASGPAATAGLQPGDLIRSIGGREIETFDDLQRHVILRPGERTDVLAERGGRTVLLPVTIGRNETVDRFGNRSAFGVMGVLSKNVVMTPLPLLELPGAALGQVVDTLRMQIDGIGQIIMGVRSVKELGGPLKIAQYSGEQLSASWLHTAVFIAAISINLGFINLLPIPMLDGGHLTFYALAAIARRPVSARVLDWSFRGGLALLLGLMVMVTFNDLASFGLF